MVGCRLRGRAESDTTEATQQQQQHMVTEIKGIALELVRDTWI